MVKMISYCPSKTDNDESTAELILRTATQVFAEKGYDGARVEEIARAAKVNKATLYYQIGDKQALYEAIIHRVMAGMADEIEEGLEKVRSAADKLRCFIETLACHGGIAQQFSSIMLREIADGGDRLPDPALRQMVRILGLLSGILELGVETGEFRRVNPLVTHMLIVGSLMVYNTNEPIRSRIAELNEGNVEGGHFIPTEEIAGYVTDQVLASVRKGAEQS
jgi:AcrR family transcriptional regulator